MVPGDGHVHTEWSWDAALGSMERTCEKAVALGVPSVAFTEHADLTPWTRGVALLVPPELDVAGYLECLERCRDRFPGLRILSGVELSEPHWHRPATERLLDSGAFDRVLGSVHCQDTGTGRYLEIIDAYREYPRDEVVRTYLAEAERMLRASDHFEVLAHLDYPLRSWPGGDYELADFEPEFREALRALKETSRLLEVNTKATLHPQIIGWWYQIGGEGITFGSDAHEPERLAHEFATAAALAQSYGFRPGRDPHDPWPRA
jgi:histidinol-phosphatase (PHP family)